MTLSIRNKYPGVYKLDVGIWRFYFCAVFTFGSEAKSITGTLFRVQTSFEILRKR